MNHNTSRNSYKTAKKFKYYFLGIKHLQNNVQHELTHFLHDLQNLQHNFF